MPTANLDSIVSVRFTPDEVARLRSEADAQGISVSHLIRKAALARLAPSTDAPATQMSPTSTGIEGSVAVTLSLGEGQVVQAGSEPEFYSLVE